MKSEFSLQLSIPVWVLIKMPFFMRPLTPYGIYLNWLLIAISIVMELADDGDLYQRIQKY